MSTNKRKRIGEYWSNYYFRVWLWDEEIFSVDTMHKYSLVNDKEWW